MSPRGQAGTDLYQGYSLETAGRHTGELVPPRHGTCEYNRTSIPDSAEYDVAATLLCD